MAIFFINHCALIPKLYNFFLLFFLNVQQNKKPSYLFKGRRFLTWDCLAEPFKELVMY